MDTSFPATGFSGNYSRNALRNLEDLQQAGRPVADYCTDSILQLDPFSSSIPYLPTSKGIKRKWSCINQSVGQQFDRLSCLWLGRSSSSSDSKGSSVTACTAISSAKETEEESSMDLDLDFALHLGNRKSPNTKKSACADLRTPVPQEKVDLGLSLCTGPSESDITGIHHCSIEIENGIHVPLTIGGPHFPNDKLEPSHWKADYFSSFCSKKMGEISFFNTISEKNEPIPIASDLSASIANEPKSSVTCTSGILQQQPHQQLQRGNSSKMCRFNGCQKGSRGASGLCISHGGGRRCQKPGCHKGAEGRTAFCKAHGGGRRCEFLGCTKSAEGRTDFCIAHGGGRRCSHEGCTRAARGKSGLCIRHGGGKRCQTENCTRSAEGLSGLCISHGGGRRCQYPTCTKGAQGSTMFCKAHGGGKRCTVDGCTKGAEGSTPFCKAHGGGKRCSFSGCPKSVHGGTSFCVAHGGGKRCAVPECTKSARGRTDFCVRHGGGKRCKFGGCSKSAQGSTDFCKAHGGGKRGSCQANRSCGSFATHGALVQDKRVHGGATMGPLVQNPKYCEPDKSKDAVTADGNTDTIKIDMKQAYLPFSEEGSSLGPVPEGRVHGGSLMAMLKAGLSCVASSHGSTLVGGPSEPTNSHLVPHRWI
ncbi:hypothetical protein Nepgr_024513 [Nepenthes gracilis]|uniref:WRKY19-like zinc finger domain-containing protein n=1 Tax=Nepenthes gracilis TaxID=150966 RepID=A0AAD3T3B7_NEPGR|nr:hypothetical protein Nepgr_024513 [Nepenthes gracilis]